MGNGLQSFGCCCNSCELVELPCCYIPLSQYLIATPPNGKKIVLSYDPTWGSNGSWIGYTIIANTGTGNPLDNLIRVELGPCSAADPNWVLRLYCSDAFQNRPWNYYTMVDCTGPTFTANFDVPTLHLDCQDFSSTEAIHGTWTVIDSGQPCTSCCCSRDKLVIHPSGRCCAAFANENGEVPLTTVIWQDFLPHGTCHLEGVSFYTIPGSTEEDCDCDICDQCQSWGFPAGLLRWVVENLPGSNPSTCMIRASLVGVADCPFTLVVYQADGITQSQCADVTMPITLNKITENINEGFDCTFPNNITYESDVY